MPPKSVLIADDDADVLTALTLRCELLGLDVRIANDATSALMMFHVERPDVLIIDINMPGGNGLSVCEMLRSDARHPDVPLIVLTGRADPETIKRCQDARIHYVRKGGDIWDRIKPYLQESLGLEID